MKRLKKEEMEKEIFKAKDKLKKIIDEGNSILCISHIEGSCNVAVLGDFSPDTISTTVRIFSKTIASMLNSCEDLNIAPFSADDVESLFNVLKRKSSGPTKH